MSLTITMAVYFKLIEDILDNVEKKNLIKFYRYVNNDTSMRKNFIKIII